MSHSEGTFAFWVAVILMACVGIFLVVSPSINKQAPKPAHQSVTLDGIVQSSKKIVQTTPECAAGTTCIRSKLLVQDPNSNTPNQFLVEDKNQAPMFWVNVGGAQSGGTPVCVMSLSLEPEACLGGPFTPSNDQGAESAVTLYGPNGTAPETLTYAELGQLLQLIGS